MKRSLLKTTLLSVTVLLSALSCKHNAEKWVSSPGGKIKVELSLNDSGQVFYAVEYAGMEVISGNRLGIVREDADFSTGLQIEKVSEVVEVADDYKLHYGKKAEAKYRANKKTFLLKNGNGDVMEIIFQVSDDGYAFRYNFPGTSKEIFKISQEISTFNFPATTLSWIQPMSKAKTGWNSCHPSYEEYYFQGVTIDSLPVHEPGWVFPALFKTDQFWISITETMPDRNYSGCRLMLNKANKVLEIGFPEPVEDFQGGAVFPESTLPWATPWRIVTLGESLGTLVESTLGTDLAKPSVIEDISFVKPGRSSWSWVLYKDDSTIYPVQKRFIDYASDMGWEYCLVDADWDQRIGYDKMGELCQYAATKNVSIIAWYNSAGDWNTTPYTPRDKMLSKESREAEFSKLKALGVKGVKVDFFGGDGQSMITYYQDLLADAARFGILVNCHGSTLPRGIQRTYPNLVSMESIKGFEFVTFDQGNADMQPTHSTVIPFTRNLFDPMDFTPVCFSEVPGRIRKTSNAFELALSVLFLSGVQHYAEVPEGMAKVPAEVKDLMKEIQVSWDETRFIDGYPGEFVVIARRKGNTWFVAGINGKNAIKNCSLDLSFIQNPSEVTFVTDGENNRTFKIGKEAVDFAQPVDLDIKAAGGFLYRVVSGS